MINSAGSVQKASFSNGKYFYNHVPAGRYLVKICTYYGNYEILTRKNGPQKISLLVAPPVQH